MQLTTLTRLAAILSLCAASAAVAHHSNAMYERTRTLDVTGTIREFQWTNPHTFIELTVDSANGPQNFTIEGPTPGVLRAQGWKFNSLKPGDKVVVKIHPLKEGRLGGGLISVTMADGKILPGGNAYAADKAGK